MENGRIRRLEAVEIINWRPKKYKQKKKKTNFKRVFFNSLTHSLTTALLFPLEKTKTENNRRMNINAGVDARGCRLYYFYLRIRRLKNKNNISETPLEKRIAVDDFFYLSKHMNI